MESPEFFTMEGRWRAEGSIQIPFGLEPLAFRAVWEGHGPYWVQQVYLEGVEEPVVNAYRIVEGDLPIILLESPHLGTLHAQLSKGPDQVGWEIQTPQLSGYEWFQRQADGCYSHTAEFTGEHGLRTLIRSVLTWDPT